MHGAANFVYISKRGWNPSHCGNFMWDTSAQDVLYRNNRRYNTIR